MSAPARQPPRRGAVWRPTVGAWPAAGSWQFRLWAPGATRVELVCDGRDARPLSRAHGGYFEGRWGDLGAGDRYGYRIDGRGPYPDPASRAQPAGVHGASALVDPHAHAWRDARWAGVELPDLVIYELHVGTFSPEGTFAGAAARLPTLAQLGVTAVELMPVASFAGSRNWGYDGAALFAPAAVYGGPDGLRAFVDEAHRLGLAVLLDVVYNHFGPDGAYHMAIEPAYAAAAPGRWGQVPNLRDAGHEGVRAFFTDNALHWLHEYHLDGLRLDATHAFVDAGTRPFLDDLAGAIRAAAPRAVLLTAEDERNHRRLIDPPAAGGVGLDAVWADDLHHQVRVAVAGDRDGYYAAYRGAAADIADTIEHGWFHRGPSSGEPGVTRGTPTDGIPRSRFVVCLQNHDQVGNRAFGDRLHHAVDPSVWRALSVLLFALPETPLLFMGQEWAAGTPFLYFTDHAGDLGAAVDRGRREEFARFAAFAAESVPSPQDPLTFARSRLDWAELDREPHRSVWQLYRRAIAWRRTHRRASGGEESFIGARALDAHTIVVERAGVHGPEACVCRLGGAGPVRYLPAVGAPEAGGWTRLFSTEDAAYVAEPRPVLVSPTPSGVELDFARAGAVVLVQRRLGEAGV